MPFPAFSAGHFQEINTKENAIISCLIYIPGVKLSAGKVLTGKKDETVRPPWRLHAKGEMSTLQTGKDTNIINKFINYPDLMIKTFSENKNICFPDFTCTHGRMCAYGRYAPEFVDLILSLNCRFPTSRNPHFGNEGECKNFLMKKKTKHFPINGLVLSLALKQRLWVSRKGLLEHVASKFQFLSRNQRIPLTGSILASINPNFNVLDHQNGDIDR